MEIRGQQLDKRPAAIHTTTDYALTQAWAETLRSTGYAGIRYKARHDPRGQLTSVALFGAGKALSPPVETTPLPIDLIHEASRTFAITVLPRRHSRRG